MNGDIKSVIESIGRLEIKKGIDEIKNNFLKLPREELNIYLSSLKKINAISSKITNLDLKNHEIQKSILIYLAMHGLVHNDDELDSKLKTLEIIKTLEENIQDKILKGYLISGLSILKIDDKDILYYKKLIIKAFHDNGGFEPDLWGVKIKWEMFKDFIKNINHKEIERLKNKYNKITLDDLVMLSNL
ncbi:MAG: hypothetical protein ACP5JU_01015 [Minisyncoccia bacterium]